MLKKQNVVILAAVLCVVSLAVGALGMKFFYNSQKQHNSKPDASLSSSPSQQDKTNVPDKSSFIGEERAKEIALTKAGISADGVHFDRVELDYDNGVWQYEVEFKKDRIEYDADIKADDGTILKWQVEKD